jgi:DNA primase
MAASKADETRDGVKLTNLDESLFEGAGATKRDLVDYLDRVSDRLIPELRDRPLSVIRVTRGQAPFMQKNVPKYTPEWVATIPLWAEASKRTVTYALCNDRRTLLWFGNQRAIEYHPTLGRVDRLDRATHLVLDLDPPSGEAFAQAVKAAHLVRQALGDVGLAGAATRAIAKRAEQLDPRLATTAFLKDDREGKVFVDATRAGGATVVAAFSPRARPGVPVSFPVAWDDLDQVAPGDFTILTAPELLGDRNPWADALPAPQQLPADLVAEGHEIPVARVAAMHEGKRRARARRDSAP